MSRIRKLWHKRFTPNRSIQPIGHAYIVSNAFHRIYGSSKNRTRATRTHWVNRLVIGCRRVPVCVCVCTSALLDVARRLGAWHNTRTEATSCGQLEDHYQTSHVAGNSLSTYARLTVYRRASLSIVRTATMSSSS